MNILIKIVDYIRTIIQLIAAILLIINAHYFGANILLTSVAWLFLIGWIFGFIERRLISIKRTKMSKEIGKNK